MHSILAPERENVPIFGHGTNDVIIFLQQDGWRPLVVAAFCGHTSIARLLLQAGADPNAPGPHQVFRMWTLEFSLALGW